MPVFSVTRRAPVDQNSLAAYEGGMGAMPSEFQLDKFDLNIGGSGPLTGSTPVPTLATQVQVDAQPKAGFWSTTADFFKSDGFNSLLNTGLTTYQTLEAKKAAERAASIADQRARTEQMLAMESIKGSQQQRELQAKLADLQIAERKAAVELQSAVAPAASSSGMPSWIMPAAIGGAGLLLVLVLMKSKK